MDEQDIESGPDLDTESTKEVVSVVNEHEDEETESKLESSVDKKDFKKLGLIFAAVLVVFVLGAIFLRGGEGVDDEPLANNDFEKEEVDNTQDIVTLRYIEERVLAGLIYWDDEFILEMQEYDEQNPNVSYKVTNTTIDVTSKGLPEHETGSFPNSNNPNSISSQSHAYSIPRIAKFLGEPTEVRIPGYTIGGIPMEPGTAERDQATGWSIEAFNVSNIFNPGVDSNNAHVQPNGTYHYHGLAQVLVTTGEEHSNLIGFAVDGFPIYGDHGYSDPTNAASPTKHVQSSWQVKEGERGAGEPSGSYNGDYTQDYEYVEGSGDLDECNGRFTVTPDYPVGTYAYFMTETFPFISRCLMGEVSESFTSANQNQTPPGAGSSNQQLPPGSPPPR